MEYYTRQEDLEYHKQQVIQLKKEIEQHKKAIKEIERELKGKLS